MQELAAVMSTEEGIVLMVGEEAVREILARVDPSKKRTGDDPEILVVSSADAWMALVWMLGEWTLELATMYLHKDPLRFPFYGRDKDDDDDEGNNNNERIK